MDTKHPLGRFSIPNVTKNRYTDMAMADCSVMFLQVSHCRGITFQNMLMVAFVRRFESQANHLEKDAGGDEMIKILPEEMPDKSMALKLKE